MAGSGKQWIRTNSTRELVTIYGACAGVARLTQDALASNIGVSRATIANMETGRQAMSAYQLVRIARALNLPSLDDLFDSRSGASDDVDAVLFRPPKIAESAPEAGHRFRLGA